MLRRGHWCSRNFLKLLKLQIIVCIFVIIMLGISLVSVDEKKEEPIVDKNFIFITVKTTFTNHGTRVPQILETWYELEPENIYFVSDAFDPVIHEKIKNHFVNTSCGYKHDAPDLGCKLNKELNLMLKRNAKWSCHFDDDNYVNIPLLKQILADFDPNIPYYLGRTATTNPMKQNGRTFWFAIGGAGFCLSHATLKILKKAIKRNDLYNIYTKSMNMPDDWGFGYMMDVHNITLTEIVSFLSQYDTLERLSLKAINETPVLSVEKSLKNFVNLPYFYDPKDDPYKFVTLHCFLFPDKCNTKYKRLRINVYMSSKLNTYGSFVLPTVKLHNS